MKAAIAPTIAPVKVPVEIWPALDEDEEAAPPTDELVVGLAAEADAPDEVTTTLEPGTNAGAEPATGADVGAPPLKRKLVSVLLPVAVAPPDIPAIVGKAGGAAFCRLCCRALLGTCMATG